MSTKKSPRTLVQEQFGGKDKLIQALLKLPAGVLTRKQDEEKDIFQQRLQKVSNQKLLRLHTLGKQLQTRKLDNKDKLADALLRLEGRLKDKPYREKMLTRSVAWLWDRLSVLEKVQQRLSKTAA